LEEFLAETGKKIPDDVGRKVWNGPKNYYQAANIKRILIIRMVILVTESRVVKFNKVCISQGMKGQNQFILDLITI